MPIKIKGALSVTLGALATTTLGGCYYGDVYGAGYASGGDCAARYGASYYDYDGYAYDDGYGYDCYDASDYGGGFVNIGFGGGWYDNYYYPGHGLWMFDRYRNRYPLRDRYLNYWGGRRAWWKHHGGRGHGQPGRPDHWTRGDGDGRPGDARPGRPGGWQRGERDRDGPRGTRPGRTDGNPPAANRPDRPDRGPGGWQRGERGDEGRRGTRPGGRPQGSIETAPPATADPARPARERVRPRPILQDGSAVTRSRPIRSAPPASGSTDNVAPPRSGSEMRRGPRNSAMPGGAPRADRPAPAFRQPPAAPRSAPMPVAVPESRAPRAERPARGNREDNISPQ